MTRETLLNAIAHLEGDFLDEALCERARLLPKAERRIKPLAVKRMGAAACLVCILTLALVFPYVRMVTTGSNGKAPNAQFFSSVEAVERALGSDLLIEGLEDALPRTSDIRVMYADTYATMDGQNQPANGDEPIMLLAPYTVREPMTPPTEEPMPEAPDGEVPDDEAPREESPSPEWSMPDSDETTEAVTRIQLYILFNCDSVADSAIGGYEEQGLTRRYGEITVHYSLIEDPLKHGQAKFLYQGDLYVLDVQSTGEAHVLLKYLDLLLGKEGES